MQAAIFNELSSMPATLEASKAVDPYGLMPDIAIGQCDAEQAYVQSELGGTKTWVSLPKERCPESFKAFNRPVVILKLSLYGHPDAGGYWEAHCKTKLFEGGFKDVDDWTSVYWHPRLKLLLMVYVDDFKMSGPSGNMIHGWALISKPIKTDEPMPVTSVFVVKYC
eukprot:7927453-Heterocapsa_arctica.AAC.1